MLDFFQNVKSYLFQFECKKRWNNFQNISPVLLNLKESAWNESYMYDYSGLTKSKVNILFVQ